MTLQCKGILFQLEWIFTTMQVIIMGANTFFNHKEKPNTLPIKCLIFRRLQNINL